MIMAKKTIKIATVFSGIGAAEFALKRLNIPHKIVFACDNGEIPLSLDEETLFKEVESLRGVERKKYVEQYIPKNKTNFVKKSYLANYGLKEEEYHFNVKFVDGYYYKNKVDLFVGGSPCQSFTLLGYQKGLEETRGTLFYEFARLVKEIEPKVFIYENVQGLLKHDKGKTWNVVKNVFDSLGYRIFYDVLDAVDYGIPQKRRRVFVVGFRDKDVQFKFPKPKKLELCMQDFLFDNTPSNGVVHDDNGGLCIKRGKGKIDDKYFLSERILPGILSHGTGGFSMKPEIDLKIARPLMSTMHKMHRAGEDNYVTTNGRIRRLIPRECLRLMGFTDDFKIVVSDTQMYRQAGNSVVVDVLMGIIKEIMKAI